MPSIEDTAAAKQARADRFYESAQRL